MFKEAVLGGKNIADNSAAADLNVLSAQFQRLKIKIRQLIDALKAQHASLVQINESRFLVAKRVAALAEDGEIASQAGTIPAVGDDPNDSYLTYMGIHHSLSSRHKMYTERFLTHVVEYSIEWEKVIVARVSTSLKQAERLRLDQDHYKAKVMSIQRDAAKVISRGKELDPKVSEKLERNEEKLRNSQKEYEIFTSDLCLLMKEVTEKSWKDLHPILLKLVQFDTTLVSDEKKILSALSSVEGTLKKIAVKHCLKPENRLKDLENLSPTSICTIEPELDTEHEETEGKEDSNDDAKSIPDLLSQKGSTDSGKENNATKKKKSSSNKNSGADSILASLSEHEPVKENLSKKVRSNLSHAKKGDSSIRKRESNLSSKKSVPKEKKVSQPRIKGSSSSKRQKDTSDNDTHGEREQEATEDRKHSHKSSSVSKSNYKGMRPVAGERSVLSLDSSPSTRGYETPKSRNTKEARDSYDTPTSQNTKEERDSYTARENYRRERERKSKKSIASPFENFLLCGANAATESSFDDDYTLDDTYDETFYSRRKGRNW